MDRRLRKAPETELGHTMKGGAKVGEVGQIEARMNECLLNGAVAYLGVDAVLL